MKILVNYVPEFPAQCLFAKFPTLDANEVLPKCTFNMNASVNDNNNYWTANKRDALVCELCRDEECPYLMAVKDVK